MLPQYLKDAADLFVANMKAGQSTNTSVSPSGEALRNHPSVRYMVLSNMATDENRHLIVASLSGSLDTILYQTYTSVLGRKPNPNIKDVGDKGRVTLKFDIKAGQSTEVDLGGNLEAGYVVESIVDPLGLFPEGTLEGDLLDTKVVQDVLRAQGERDKASGG